MRTEVKFDAFHDRWQVGWRRYGRILWLLDDAGRIANIGPAPDSFNHQKTTVQMVVDRFARVDEVFSRL